MEELGRIIKYITSVEIDVVEDQEWHQVQHKVKWKGTAMQRDKINTNGNALQKVTWEKIRVLWDLLGKNTCEITYCVISYKLTV